MQLTKDNWNWQNHGNIVKGGPIPGPCVAEHKYSYGNHTWCHKSGNIHLWGEYMTSLAVVYSFMAHCFNSLNRVSPSPHTHIQTPTYPLNGHEVTTQIVRQTPHPLMMEVHP